MPNKLIPTADGTLINSRYIATARPIGASDQAVNFDVSLPDGSHHTLPIQTPVAAQQIQEARAREATIREAVTSSTPASTTASASPRGSAPASNRASMTGQISEATAIMANLGEFVADEIAKAGPVIDVHK